MTELEQIKKQNEAILRRLDQLATAAKAPKWVRSTVITELTGWDNQKMRRARENSTITFKKDNGGLYWYDLNSLHPYLLKKQTV